MLKQISMKQADGVLGVGEHIAGRAQDLRRDHGGAAAGAGCGQALAGAGDDEKPMNQADVNCRVN
ncbi:hypothetical protein ACQP1K_13525 [Sphaerimonospora sp. CA-214678]|uniref:hypothetical protein n=1 Tax=Sphaerimonospora sp. CA-214678 TaxID=3240029 RepID=UPI003D8C9EDE